MSKYLFSAIIVLCIVFGILKNIECTYFDNYPKICLPEKAHNTIGEIPIIEHLDDGQVTLPNKTIVKTSINTVCACTSSICYSDRQQRFSY